MKFNLIFIKRTKIMKLILQLYEICHFVGGPTGPTGQLEGAVTGE